MKSERETIQEVLNRYKGVEIRDTTANHITGEIVEALKKCRDAATDSLVQGWKAEVNKMINHAQDHKIGWKVVNKTDEGYTGVYHITTPYRKDADGWIKGCFSYSLTPEGAQVFLAKVKAEYEAAERDTSGLQVVKIAINETPQHTATCRAFQIMDEAI